MEFHVEVREVAAETVAVARALARRPEVSQTVLALMGKAWDFIRHSGLKGGNNVAIYKGDPSKVPIEAGARVPAPFTASDDVFCSATPAGLAATTTLMGPYNRIPDAHAAVVSWCAEHGRELAGPNWEVYGHWSDDPAKIRTDVFYLLKASEK